MSKFGFSIIKATFWEWLADQGGPKAAAIAFYALLSMAPMLIIIIAIADFFFGEAAAQNQIVAIIGNWVGQEGAEAIQSVIEKANRENFSGFAAILGIIVMVFAATTLFARLQDMLNHIWGVEENERGFVMNILIKRTISVVMILCLDVLLLFSLVLSSVMSGLSENIKRQIPGGDWVLFFIDFFLALFLLTLIFALIFKYLPDVKIRWRHVWVGSFVTALMFNIGKEFIGFYLGRSTLASAYGAAGSLVVLLLWIYYSVQVLFMGAEFTQVWARRRGEGIQPEDHVTLKRDAGSGQSTDDDLEREAEEAKEKVRGRRLKGGLVPGSSE